MILLKSLGILEITIQLILQRSHKKASIGPETSFVLIEIQMWLKLYYLFSQYGVCSHLLTAFCITITIITYMRPV